MKIMRVSPVTGVTNYMEINVTEEQLDEWRGGALIQNVLPHLSEDEREFLITGCTPDDWKNLFGDDSGRKPWRARL